MTFDTIDVSHFGSERRRRNEGTITLILDEEGASYVAQIMRKEHLDLAAREIAEKLEQVIDRRTQERL